MKRFVSTAAFVSVVQQKKPTLPLLSQECRQSLLAAVDGSNIQQRLLGHQQHHHHHHHRHNPMQSGVRLRVTPVLPDHDASLDVDGFVRQDARPSSTNNHNNHHSSAIESPGGSKDHLVNRDQEVTMAILLLNVVAIIWGTQVNFCHTCFFGCTDTQVMAKRKIEKLFVGLNSTFASLLTIVACRHQNGGQ